MGKLFLKKFGMVDWEDMVIYIFSFMCFGQILSFKGYSMVVEWVMVKSSWFIYDYLNTSLISLTVFVVIISLISSDESFMSSGKWLSFFLSVVMIGVVCICFFSCMDLIPFFFFFESSLIPTVVLILGWGYQPERLQAGLQMIIYTVCGSLPLLVLIISTWYYSGTDNMFIMSYLHDGMGGDSFLFWFLFLVGMLVKIPVFSVHGWLPKAHVEAPLSGSMMLAGILLKLGIYGVCRVTWSVGTPPNSFIIFVLSLSLWGGVVCSLLCLCFHDVKSVIAYSSIAHMALSLGGIFSFNNLGWMGGVCMAIAHGVCSPCLFSLANYTYMGTGSRSILLCKGLLKSMPSLSAMWFIFCVINMGCPPSINFYSECMLFCSIMGFSYSMLPSLFLLCFLAAGYSLFLYTTINHGYQTNYNYNYNGLSIRFLISMFISLLILFGLFIVLDLVFL
uniref:NADH-ubiquinone oxidoreductase chain 4 n=1 Tax=Semelidae sp. STW-2017 TaxID=1969324 RepID=A0A1U9XPB2_9BIVA|nr:NADH dehydrogenase subunit 4 [Semelidae sp. STW-2017]